MLDGLFEAISAVLNFFYGFTHNYAIAIALLTCAVMLLTTPLTLKSTRSMIEMQRLQPEIRRLQAKHKDDRQKLNEEMMAFYKEHQINPLGGCLPMLVQLPVFSVLYWVVRGLINEANFVGLQRALSDYGVPNPLATIGADGEVGFKPKYLSQDTELYQALLGQTEMKSFGIDLALSPSQALGEGFVTALPYVLLVLIIAGLSWLQQKQIMGRSKGSEVSQQQRMMMRIGPVMYVGFTFLMPLALGVYFLISTLWRVAQQGYITHSLYKGEDSVGVQAQRAMAEARAQKAKDGKDGKKDGRAAAGGATKKRAPAKSAKATKSARATKSAKSGSARATGSRASRGSRNGVSTRNTSQSEATEAASTEGASSGGAKSQPHPRSRKKKKRK